MRNDGTNTSRIIIVDLDRHTTKLFFPFFLAIPSVITITQALRGRLLNQLPEYTGFTRDSVVPGDNSLKRTRFIDMACEGGLGIM